MTGEEDRLCYAVRFSCLWCSGSVKQRGFSYQNYNGTVEYANHLLTMELIKLEPLWLEKEEISPRWVGDAAIARLGKQMLRLENITAAKTTRGAKPWNRIRNLTKRPFQAAAEGFPFSRSGIGPTLCSN